MTNQHDATFAIPTHLTHEDATVYGGQNEQRADVAEAARAVLEACEGVELVWRAVT